MAAKVTQPSRRNSPTRSRSTLWMRWPRAAWRAGRWCLRSGRRLGHAALDLAIPPVCAWCRDPLSTRRRERGLCRACRRSLPRWSGVNCPRCWAPSPAGLGAEAPCQWCRQRSYRFDAAWALGPYVDSLRDVVLAMKQADEPLIRALSLRLAAHAKRSLSREQVDLIVPVPIPLTRRVQRGLSVTELLAAALAARWKRPWQRALRAARNPAKQGTLTPPERVKNVRGAFALAPRGNLRGTTVMLVDDVMTTGATVSEAAKVLKRGGAGRVVVVTVARGTGAGTGPL